MSNILSISGKYLDASAFHGCPEADREDKECQCDGGHKGGPPVRVPNRSTEIVHGKGTNTSHSPPPPGGTGIDGWCQDELTTGQMGTPGDER